MVIIPQVVSSAMQIQVFGNDGKINHRLTDELRASRQISSVSALFCEAFVPVLNIELRLVHLPRDNDSVRSMGSMYIFTRFDHLVNDRLVLSSVQKEEFRINRTNALEVVATKSLNLSTYKKPPDNIIGRWKVVANVTFKTIREFDAIKPDLQRFIIDRFSFNRACEITWEIKPPVEDIITKTGKIKPGEEDKFNTETSRSSNTYSPDDI